MEKFIIVTRAGCPYCQALDESIKSVLEKHPELGAAEIDIIEEESGSAAELDHFYAPAFFVGGEKISEGDGGEEAVAQALRAAVKRRE